MVGIYREPPIPYKSNFDSTKPKLVTLSTYDRDDHSDSVKVPLFTNKGGLEELLHTEEAFSNAAEDLSIGEANYIKYFGRCLCVNAQSKWRALTNSKENNRDKYPPTKAGYEETFKAFIRMYCNPEDAKDIMHVYLQSPACKKKIELTCQDHTERLLTLIKYTSSAPVIAAIRSFSSSSLLLSLGGVCSPCITLRVVASCVSNNGVPLPYIALLIA